MIRSYPSVSIAEDRQRWQILGRSPDMPAKVLGLGAALVAGCGVALADASESDSGDLARATLAAETRALGERVAAASVQPAQQGPKVGGYLQFRYMITDADIPGGEDLANGFQIQRTRLVVSGSIGGEEGEPKFDYLFRPFAGPTGQWSILDAWVKYQVDERFTVQAGQFKLPFWREWLIGETFNLPVERSEVTATFSSLYAQGVQVGYNQDQFRAKFAFSDGLRSFNTGFTNDSEAEYALTARGEYLAFGEWGQFSDNTALNAEQDALMFGAAIHHQGETDNFRGVEIDSLTQVTADVSAEIGELALLGAGVFRLLEPAVGDETVTFGGLAQAAYLIREDVELIGRYELIAPDSDAVNDDVYHAITGGVNWYIRGHAAKLTVDAVYSFGSPGETDVIGFGPNSSTGLLNGEDEQLALRAQFQFIF